MVKAGEITEVEISLAPVSVTLEGVEVKSSSIPATVGRQTVGVMEIRRIPGSAGDALRALQALAGDWCCQRFRRSTLYPRRCP